MGTAVTRLVRSKKIGNYKDAKKSIFIDVTEIDVARAQVIAPDQCAMAKATCRAIPNALKTFFYEYGAYIATFDPRTKKKETLRYIPSPEARKAIAVFDATGRFTPGRYRLDAPYGSSTLVNIRKRSKKRPGRHKPGKTNITRPVRDLTGSRRGRLQFAFAY
jgi:hypothetical protein